MGLLVDCQQARGIDLGIALGGGKRGVAEQLLDRAQTPTPGEKMGCEAVAQRMRRRGRGEAQQKAQALAARGARLWLVALTALSLLVTSTSIDTVDGEHICTAKSNLVERGAGS